MNRRKLVRAIAILLAILLAGSAVVSAVISLAYAEEEAPNDPMILKMEYLEEAQALRVSQRIVYRNASERSLDRVLFYLPANLLRRLESLPYEGDALFEALPEGYLPSGVELDRVLVDGEAVDYGFQGEDEMYLRAACSLAPGESAQFEFDYYLLLSENAAFLGISDDGWRLSGFYFAPASLDSRGEFLLNPPLSFTSYAATERMDVQASITLPENYQLAATGEEWIDDGAVGDGAADVTINDGAINAGTAVAGAIDTGAVGAGAVDAGAVDAGEIDTGAVDTGAVGAGAVDAGAVDAGAVENGEIDTEAVDAGAVDAGEIDTEAVDAGAVGGGAGQEAGARQAGSNRWEISAENVRSFALAFGKRYRVYARETQGGVSLRCLTNVRAVADDLLEVAAEAAELCQSWFGPFPYPQLDFVQADIAGDSLASAGCLWLSADLLRNDRERDHAVRAFVARQYFGERTGAQPCADAWLSDALCEYLAYLLLDETRGHDAYLAALNERVVPSLQLTIPGGLHVSSDASLFTAGEYRIVTLDRGAAVFHELRTAMGEGALLAGLRLFYERGLRADYLTEMDLVDSLNEATGEDWEPYLTDYLFNIDEYVNQSIDWLD